MFGVSEGLIILAIVVLLFGGKKLPELAKALGQSLNSFKKGLNESKDSQEDVANQKVEGKVENKKDDSKKS